MSKHIITVPDIGSSDPVDVIEISVKVGDQVAAEDTLIVLESDKATVEVPAPRAGTVAEVLVKVGDRIKEGDPMVAFADGEAADSDDQAATEPPQTAASADSAAAAKPAPTDRKADANSDDSSDSSAGGSRKITVPVPDLGDISDAEIIELSIAAGDRVTADQIVAVIESDKASLELPAPEAGTVVAVTVKVGDKVNSGDAFFELEVTAGAAPAAASEPAAPASPVATRDAPVADHKPTAAKPPAAASAQPTADTDTNAPVHAGPAVRRLARELGVSLVGVAATGPRGRILKEDLHAFVKQALTAPAATGGSGLPALPEIDFAKFGTVEAEPLSKLRKAAASNLHRAWLTIPHVTQFDEADITDLEAFRQSENQRLKASGDKLTMLAFLVAACAKALRAFPRFNSSLSNDGETLILKQYVHIGVAVDTPNGLVVPVIRDADRKGIVEIAREVSELAGKARDRKLTPGDMQGGCFSISSLGGIGGTAFTPIVNWPEVAILGVSRTQTKAVWDGSGFVPRDMLPLSLSYDHRVIDGADAARFTSYLSALLADLRRVLL